MNVFGVIGGLGPKATSKFYLDTIRKYLKKCERYPQILVDNVSFPRKLEQEIIQNCRNENEMLPYLMKSVRRLNKAGADFLVMPCNTLHIFIEDLRRESRVPVLSIIDETIRLIKQNKYKKIGLLATSKTVESDLFENGIELILPDEEEQNEISGIELRILKHQVTEKDRNFMDKIIVKLSKRGSDAIIIGCTDLYQVINFKDREFDIIDTLEILINSSFERMMRGESK
ncbi:MAG: amino acid racemase [Candidatus Aenigmarchaeota archaeon]|nr:amino acid racemase [Candidatus Aenigmarchaeota archaeon]